MVVAWPVVFVTANLFAAFLKPAVNGAAWVGDVCVSVFGCCVHVCVWVCA